MVGSPGQTVDDLVQDLLFIREFEPQMIGIGPVSYTHLDVYKRQIYTVITNLSNWSGEAFCPN